MRILVIGANGMLGAEFVRQLQARGQDEVIGCGRSNLDIANEQEVMQKVAALKPQMLINCAAYNNVDKAEDEAEVAMKINGEAVGYLAKATASCGAIFVHFSTDYVFDGETMDGYREDDEPRPISKYGDSKLLGEKRILSIFRHPEERSDEGSLTNVSNAHTREILRYAQNDRGGGRWYIIRTSKLFGSAGAGATSKKSFPEMMLGFAREKGRIEAIDAEKGSPTYVKDLAQTVLKMIQDGAPSGMYHITNSGLCTWYEYAKAAVEFAGVNAEVVPVPPDRFPRKAKRPANSTLLNTKLPPLRPWQEALKEFLSLA